MSIHGKGLNHKERVVVRGKEIGAEASNLKDKCQGNYASFVISSKKEPLLKFCGKRESFVNGHEIELSRSSVKSLLVTH
jgi:hypothetical protein